MERVESLMIERASDGDNNAESERSRLKAAFEKLADAEGFLMKDQLQALAGELAMRDALGNSEIDEIWRQVQQSDQCMQTHEGIAAPPASKISFEALWKWWMSDAVYDVL